MECERIEIMPFSLLECLCGDRQRCGRRQSLAISGIRRRGAFIDKLVNQYPDEQRLIRVIDVLFSGYASIRFRQTENWRLCICPRSMRGAVPASATHNVMYGAALEAELASATKSLIGGVTMDRMECFD